MKPFARTMTTEMSVLEAGRATCAGAGGAEAVDRVRAASAV